MDLLTTDDYIIPGEVTLHKAYPNPFNPVTNISFTLPEYMNVDINVIDIQGRLVKHIASGFYSQGLNNITLDAHNLSSGLYFVQLLAGENVEYIKILLLK